MPNSRNKPALDRRKQQVEARRVAAERFRQRLLDGALKRLLRLAAKT